MSQPPRCDPHADESNDRVTHELCLGLEADQLMLTSRRDGCLQTMLCGHTQRWSHVYQILEKLQELFPPLSSQTSDQPRFTEEPA